MAFKHQNLAHYFETSWPGTKKDSESVESSQVLKQRYMKNAKPKKVESSFSILLCKLYI